METRPGIHTTEFWLTVAGNAAVLITTIAGVLPPEYAAIAVVVANALYAISRGIAKANIKPD